MWSGERGKQELCMEPGLAFIACDGQLLIAAAGFRL